LHDGTPLVNLNWNQVMPRVTLVSILKSRLAARRPQLMFEGQWWIPMATVNEVLDEWAGGA
jgi:hypothetical protein